MSMIVCIRNISRKFAFKSKVRPKIANLGLVATRMQVVFRELLITVGRSHIQKSLA